MNEIGELLQETRESAGISLEEVSKDLDIEVVILKNIEDGKSGAFSDMFVLKEYISNYSKYLGLNEDEIIDEFNEYIFESTSRIPIKKFEKKVIENKKEEERVSSPYTQIKIHKNNGVYVIVYLLLIITVIFAVVWCVKTIVIDRKRTSAVIGGKYELTK